MKYANKTKILLLAVIMAVTLPFSAFAAGAEPVWGWTGGINTAVENGKAVELNKIFEYGDHKIKFENAVWEDYALLVAFSVPDADKEDSVLPSQISLVNEEGKSVSQGHGSEYGGNGKGVLEFNLNRELIKGDKLYLKIHTLRKAGREKPDYTYTMVLDKSLSADGAKYNPGKEIKTDYGTLKFVTASNSRERLSIDYTFDYIQEIKELTKSDPDTNIFVHDLFPQITLTDANKKVFRANGRSSGDEGKYGSLYFDGMPELNKPVTISVTCSEKVANWSLPIPVKKAEVETVSVNKEYKSEGGSFKIKNIYLGSASTYLDYEFIPDKGYEVTRLEPLVSMNIRNKNVQGSTSNGDLAGKIIFKYPITRKDLKDVAFYVDSVKRSIKYGQSIKIDFDKTPGDYKIKVDGSEIQVTNLKIKDGKTTCFDLEVNDSNRKFSDFDVGIKADTQHLSWSSSSSSDEFENIFDKLKEGLGLTSQDGKKSPLKKSIQVDGEHKKLEVEIESLVYSDSYKSEIKLN